MISKTFKGWEEVLVTELKDLKVLFSLDVPPLPLADFVHGYIGHAKQVSGISMVMVLTGG